MGFQRGGSAPDGDGKFAYDVQKRARAGTAASMRAIVAAYLLYLAWRLFKGALKGESSMPAPLSYGAAAVFALFAVAFGVYIYKRWRTDVEAARLPEEKSEKEPPKDS